MEGLEDEADRVAPQPGQRFLAQLVDAAPVQPHLPGRGALQPAEQVQQRRLPAAARPHHGHRLAGAHLEIDAVDGTHEAVAPAVFLPQPARAHDRLVRRRSLAFIIVPSLRSSIAAQASSQRRSACSRSTTPSSSSAGDRAVRLGQRGPLRAASRHSSAWRCASTSRTGSASPAAAAATSLRWNSAGAGFGQLVSASHSATRCVPRRGQLVDLAIRAIGLADPLRGHQAGLLEPSQRHVHLARVHRLRQRAERELKPGAQLIAVRGLLGQQREQDLLHDPQLIAARRLLDRHANGF